MITVTVTEQPILDVFVLTASAESPDLVNYDIMGLHKKRTFVKGELSEQYYYQEYDAQSKAYSGLAVKETNVYARQNGFIFSRQKTIHFYKMDGTVGCEKVTMKYYEDLEKISEGVTRRQNIVNEVKMTAWGLVGDVAAFDLLASLKPEIDLYIESSLVPLYNALQNLDRAYLNTVIEPVQGVTVRMYLFDLIFIPIQ